MEPTYDIRARSEAIGTRIRGFKLSLKASVESLSWSERLQRWAYRFALDWISLINPSRENCVKTSNIYFAL